MLFAHILYPILYRYVTNNPGIPQVTLFLAVYKGLESKSATYFLLGVNLIGFVVIEVLMVCQVKFYEFLIIKDDLSLAINLILFIILLLKKQS